jgi:hypothetical protein
MKRLSRFRSVASLLAFCAASAFATLAWADSPRVVRVEEHWELQVAQPDSGLSAPQTTMVMSPTDNIDGVHFLVTLNHSTVPNYAPGGVQVQLWDGDVLVNAHSAHDGEALTQSEEVVNWVQRMTISDGHLSFQVLNGQSETWGAFGGDDLTVSESTSLTSLNSYHPGVSLTESQVGYAENRVVSLTLTKLVWETEDGVVHEQNAPIPIDTSLDN